MPKPYRAPRCRAGATPVRDALVALWDHRMRYWRIDGHVYPQEQFLQTGADVLITSGRLADALAHAGQPTERFDDAGPDADKVWLLGADDTLTEIRDEHVEAMPQADFDELVDGTGPLRHRVGGAYNPQAAVERHRALTAAIRARIG